VHAAAVHTKALSQLNAPDSNGSYSQNCSPLFVFDPSLGVAQFAPHSYDGCDRNPGGICHNRGGLDTVDCGYRFVIPGPPATEKTYYENEFLIHTHCTTECLVNTLAILTLPFGGGEAETARALEAGGELLADTAAAEGARFLAGSGGRILDTEAVRVPAGKFDYLLGNPSKSGVFADSMGFSDEATLEAALRRHLVENYGDASSSVPMVGGGTKFTVTGPMTGPSGATWNITTVWGVDADGTVRLITATP